jgi:hypothetical protein
LRIGKTKRAVDLLSDKRFVKLDANLRYFREKYDAILASHDERHNRLASVHGTPHRRVDTAGAPVGSGQGSALAHQRIPGPLVAPARIDPVTVLPIAPPATACRDPSGDAEERAPRTSERETRNTHNYAPIE